jgi:hypothetical protein
MASYARQTLAARQKWFTGSVSGIGKNAMAETRLSQFRLNFAHGFFGITAWSLFSRREENQQFLSQ